MFLSPKERSEFHENLRKETVERWFQGDERAAERVLDALPYSTIPDYYDVGVVMEVIFGWLHEGGDFFDEEQL